jgi:glutamyl-tRNA reductase
MPDKDPADRLIADLAIIGLSHRTAPLEIRERLAVPPDEIQARLADLAVLPGVKETALLSTCNRIEIYAVSTDTHAILDTLRDHLCTAWCAGAPALQAGLAAHLYTHSGADALRHLFRVTSSLDSLVVGESQILGQVKDACESASQAKTTGPRLGFVFPRAFGVARRVRRETAIARHPVSVSSIAVEVARQVWSGLEGRRVLVIGAGKMAVLAARDLHAQGAKVTVTNRTAERAAALAAELACEVEPFSELDDALARADIVISSTGSRTPILDYARIDRVQRARRFRHLVLIDIAVPRDVDPAADRVAGVFRWDIDNLQAEAARGLEGRRSEVEHAEALIEEEVRSALGAARSRGAGPTITALRARYMEVAAAEVAKAVSALPLSDERNRHAMAALGEAIVTKLLHDPQVALKTSAASQDGEAMIQAARALFDLPDPNQDQDVDGAVAVAGERQGSRA